jgi:hypothetical protein
MNREVIFSSRFHLVYQQNYPQTYLVLDVYRLLHLVWFYLLNAGYAWFYIVTKWEVDLLWPLHWKMHIIGSNLNHVYSVPTELSVTCSKWFFPNIYRVGYACVVCVWRLPLFNNLTFLNHVFINYLSLTKNRPLGILSQWCWFGHCDLIHI